MQRHRGGTDDIVLPLHAEELVVGKRRRTTSLDVRLTTRTRDERVQMELLRDTVVVERRPIGTRITSVPPIREEDGDIVVPIVEEVLVTECRLILREEIRLRRVRTARRHVETVSLRYEEVAIERAPISEDCNQERAMSETIVALFESSAQAELAVQDLIDAGVSERSIDRHEAAHDPAYEPGLTEPRQAPGFWSRLFGGEPDHGTAAYDRTIESGGTVVTVRPTAAQLNEVVMILEGHHPIDMDERDAAYREQDAREAAYGRVPAAADDATTLKLAAEELSVGKRLVNRGGTRVRRYVVEVPVEETVSLREEHVAVERRPVSGGQTVADDSFTDRTISMTETDEEPTIAKHARVVEEVALRKDVRERDESIRDTVRREDVAVERLPGDASRI